MDNENISLNEGDEISIVIFEKEVRYLDKHYKIPKKFEKDCLDIINTYRNNPDDGDLCDALQQFIYTNNIQPYHQQPIDGDEPFVEYEWLQSVELTNIKDDNVRTTIYDGLNHNVDKHRYRDVIKNYRESNIDSES